MPGSNRAPKARARLPGYVHLALAMGVLVLVTAVAIRSAIASPPAIAEFAPQPQQPIKQAPAEQTSSIGTAAGGAAVGPNTPAPSPSAAAPGAVYLRCVGDPPRQIEDPQSPPCVPYWTGKNGGATYKGVSTGQINVCVPHYSGLQSGQTPYPLLQTFFNTRFELYGRQLNLINTNADNKGSDAPSERAAADNCDQLHHAFGSLDYDDGLYYYEELAHDGLVSSGGQTMFTEGELRSMSPYTWQYPMATERMFGSMGVWVCHRLAGGKAVHAGDPLLAQRERIFGVVLLVENTHDSKITADPLLTELAACGVHPAKVLYASSLVDPSGAENNVLALKQAGVTSVICLCHDLYLGDMYHAATNQSYFPEWLTTTYITADQNGSLHDLAGNPQQLAHTFGITFWPREMALSKRPEWGEIKEVDPSYDQSFDSLDAYWLINRYKALLVFAAGVQMAGPDLTPQNFARGLQSMSFPYPQNDPYFEGSVGFNQPLDHSMTDDAAEWWWGANAIGPYPDDAGSGAVCYVARGRRYTSDEWPTGGDPFFQGACDSGV